MEIHHPNNRFISFGQFWTLTIKEKNDLYFLTSYLTLGLMTESLKIRLISSVSAFQHALINYFNSSNYSIINLDLITFCHLQLSSFYIILLIQILAIFSLNLSQSHSILTFAFDLTPLNILMLEGVQKNIGSFSIIKLFLSKSCPITYIWNSKV